MGLDIQYLYIGLYSAILLDNILLVNSLVLKHDDAVHETLSTTVRLLT